MSICTGCGRSLAERVQRGPLIVDRDPPAAYWRGVMIQGLGGPALGMLRMLVRFGQVSIEALEMVHAGESRSATYVHVKNLRRIIADTTREIIVHNRTGWGYWIEIAGVPNPSVVGGGDGYSENVHMMLAGGKGPDPS